MLKFKYKVAGSSKEGFIFADSKNKAIALLNRQGIQVSILTLVGRDNSSSAADNVRKLNSKVALPFLQRLVQLHGAGLPLGDTLKILQTRLKDPKLKDLAVVLWRDLSEGKSLASAMKSYPNVFGDDIIYPIEAAEVTGNLTPVLSEIIRLLSEREHLKKKIISGMTYPVLVSCAAIFVVIFFLFFLLPRIESMLTAMGGSMTLPARILIGCSNLLLYGLPIVIVGTLGLTFGITQWRKRSELGVLKTDTLLLKIPFIGSIVRYTEICRVSNLLSTLLGSGVNLTEAMRLTERSIHNLYFRQQYQEARGKINDGVALTTAFKLKGLSLFTDLAMDILVVGENTGNMSASFKEVYRLHNEDLDAKFNRLTTMITSGALGFAFLMVGVLAMGIVSSVMQFSSSIKM
ncbi:MAG: type II secretion system F family protein [bacterium]